MQTGQVTTGLRPLTINSTELFECSPWLNGQPWSLSGGSAILKLADPSGNLTTIPGTLLAGGYGATAPWTVIGPIGQWARAWVLTDGLGIIQVSEPISFEVVSSPI